MKIIREVFEDIPSELWLLAFIGGIIGGYLFATFAE